MNDVDTTLNLLLFIFIFHFVHSPIVQRAQWNIYPRWKRKNFFDFLGISLGVRSVPLSAGFSSRSRWVEITDIAANQLYEHEWRCRDERIEYSENEKQKTKESGYINSYNDSCFRYYTCAAPSTMSFFFFFCLATEEQLQAFTNGISNLLRIETFSFGMRNQKFLKFSARRTEWPNLPATEQESNIWMHKKRGGGPKTGNDG